MVWQQGMYEAIGVMLGGGEFGEGWTRASLRYDGGRSGGQGGRGALR